MRVEWLGKRMIPKNGHRFPAVAEPASAGEGRSEKIRRTKSTRKMQAYPALFRLLPACRGGGLLGGRNGTCGWSATGEPFDHRARRVAPAAIAHSVKQRGSGARTADERLRIGQHDRIVPGALHDERKLEGDCLRLAGGDQAGGALEIEFALRDRGRTCE